MTAACPACGIGAPPVHASATAAPTHQLLLPGIHCAGCIRTVETTLNALPEITSARVNLTRKKVAITAFGDADITGWIEALDRAGIEAHEITGTDPTPEKSLLPHLGVAGFAMMNVMLISVAVWSGAVDTTREFLHWIAAAIALPATAFAAQPFFASAWRALRVGRLNMDVPISLAILLACGMSLFEVASDGEHAWFDAALSLTFFLLAGRYLDQRMRQSARSAAQDLAALEPARVMRIDAGRKASVPVADIRLGDTLWLAAGARVPVDAELQTENASIDRSAITGESDPQTCLRGARIVAGDVLLTGPVTLRALAVGEDTTLRRFARLVTQAEQARSRYNGLAQQAAAIYTPAVHVISAAAFAGWWLATGDLRMALNVAIATLIITCPCALGLAVPAVSVAATARLYRLGLLVKSETALERLATVDTVVFDKTGTLTRRSLTPPATLPAPHAQVLRALADASDHPLCRQLRGHLRGVTPAQVENLREDAGDGISATWQATPVRLGRAAGETVFTVGGALVPLRSSETLLPEAAETVAALRDLGLEVCLLTGDTARNADAVATQLGMDRVWSGVTAETKSDIIREMQGKGRRVLMVGDGLNDTAALALADASIAPGTALDASRSAADVVLISGGLGRVVQTLRIARIARRRILQNFAIAAAYNSIAVPIAVAGLATPLMAAIAMSSSSITVVTNALRMRRS